MKFDCTIDSLDFLFATNQQNPYRRETADFRRQRIDQEREVGEQSLDSGFWLRSQASFHMGSGITSTEPLSVPAEEARFRYRDSHNVDPWSPGELKLLHETYPVAAGVSANTTVLGLREDTALFVYGATMKAIWWDGAAWNVLPATNPLTGGHDNPLSLTSDGSAAYFVGDQELAGYDPDAIPESGVLYNGGTDLNLVRWLKQRLIVADGRSLIEVTDLAPAVVGALPAAFYTHPTLGWTWTDAAEGPEAMYLSGYAGDTSGIYSVTVTDNGAGGFDLGTPTLVADMPRGERVLSTYSYIGTYLIVGTNKGVRVAQIRDGGTLVLGPLIVECDGSFDAVAEGRYVWVTVGGTKDNLYRIDLGRPLDGDLAFASAPDLHYSDDAAVTSVTSVAGRRMFVVASVGLIMENTGTYASSGWLETGRIRMNTLQDKSWLDATLSRVPDANFVDSMQVRLLTASEADGPWYQSVTIDSNDSVATKYESGVITNPTQGPDLYVKLELQPTLSGSEIKQHTPVLTGYQVSSIPAPARSRLVQVPIQVWDWEKDRNGKIAGRDGYAWERLSALEALESDAAVVSYVDHTTGESSQAYIERVTFTRLTPPFRGEDNSGGVATVLLRILG
jgi:hypothetical protein